ncbi:hypothetical protein GCM10011613_30190 [Cellvibrio zantedeschiae]|uniref:Lipoprotein n=1 Tax=Cellvibrio zantedeschiae TaxID=1237077 RepID=A0ABQ3BAI2_9GAMM|nr:hypothetical protein [Cellvibrio zantedeschiae]GGY83271.1 hypothetical protein GCM10011613_30190 [Cellvibrio zantedeschiae]
MKSLKLFSLVLFAILLSACASQPKSAYKPATNAGFGYKEIALANNLYRVEFKISGNAKRANDYALLRAADITTNEGFDWFQVLKRDSFTGPEEKFGARDIGSRQLVTRRCGLLTCRDEVQSLSGSTMDDMGKVEDTTAVLEIKLGKGVRPALDNTYDAYETSEKLRAQYSLK